MDQNMDKGRNYSRRATQKYKPKIKGHIQYLERYVLHIW